VPDADVIHDEVICWRKREPFIPFTIVLADGSRCDVMNKNRIVLNEQYGIAVLPRVGLKKFRLVDVVAVKRQSVAR